MNDAYTSLADHFSRISDLEHVQSICSWDEAAMMPEGGGSARGQAMASLGVVVHELKTDPRIGDWLDAASNLPLDEWQAANVREIRREYQSQTCLPSDLVRAMSVANSTCEQAWRNCRARNDWETMEPLLAEVVRLARESAAIRSEALGLGRYDALLDTYEPDMRAEVLDDLFGRLKEFLPGFVEEVLQRQAATPVLPLGDYFPVERQRELGERVMGILGFDFNHGRLDVSHHPFCGGVQEDVRITTRYETGNFVSSLMAVIHETGHAMYEQGRPAHVSGQPVSLARSSGVHESQSLLMEMQACRSREFITFLAPLVREVFGASADDAAWSADNLYRLYTRVDRSFIRVDADEVTYPLHVILRYEIERDLIEGNIEVRDIPALWREKMQGYLQVETEGNYRDGCLQDVHWPAGLFGYFPTYTLGAMMAAQLFGAARRDLANLSDDLARGDFSGLLGWLRHAVHGKGSLLGVDELMISASGERLNADWFIGHLKARYGD